MSDNYTKMCEKAKWLQNGWIYKFGDNTDKGTIVETSKDSIVIFKQNIGSVRYYRCDKKFKQLIFKPSIEQLMDMVRQHHDCTKHDVREAYYSWHAFKYEYHMQLWSFGAVYLAFVASELRNETWDGEQWKVQ